MTEIPTNSSSESTPDQRKSRSSRTMTAWRLVLYRMAVGLAVLVLEILWRTCRFRILGEDRLQRMIDEHGAVVPVCWHQHLLLGARYMVARRIQGMSIGFLISPSVDGEAPSMLARAYGAQVIRGSGTYTGAQAVRALYKQIKVEKLSPVITPDGPKGPRFEFKGGAVTVAQLCGVPIVPFAYAASRVKIFRTWDKFIFPFPFTRIVILIGEPYLPPRKLSTEQADLLHQEMAQRLHMVYRQAAAELKNK
jgi:hypothetical protein